MFDTFKAAFKEKVLRRDTLTQHDVILEDLIKTKVKVQITFEEAVQLHGFPIGRIIRQGTHQRM